MSRHLLWMRKRTKHSGYALDGSVGTNCDHHYASHPLARIAHQVITLGKMRIAVIDSGIHEGHPHVGRVSQRQCT